MTVLLVLFTFILFLLIDHFMTRNRVVVATKAVAPRPTILTPALVNGFHLPDNMFYHPGHTWALAESPSLVRVGMDEFASKMLGNIDSITLPARGTWVRQGQKFATIVRDGKSVSLISPIEGAVSDVNPEAANKPAYGEGWLMTVQSPDQKVNIKNLLRGAVARWWMQEAASRFNPAMAQDGGEAVNDFVVASGKDWEATAKEFLLN